MPILSKEEAQAILKKTVSFSKADECTVNLNGSEGGNIRYARNAVSTAGDISQMSLAVTSAFGKASRKVRSVLISIPDASPKIASTRTDRGHDNAGFTP